MTICIQRHCAASRGQLAGVSRRAALSLAAALVCLAVGAQAICYGAPEVKTNASATAAPIPKSDALTTMYTSLVTPAAPQNIPNYRIPSIVRAPNGDVLAFMERRTTGPGDIAKNEMVFRRSHDQGHTWGKDELLLAGKEFYANSDPVPLVDSKGRIWFFFVRDRKDYVVMTSDDSGKTWTPIRSIHKEIIPPEWDAYKHSINHGPDGSAQNNAEKKDSWEKDWNQRYGVGCGAAAVEMHEGPHAGRIVVPARALQMGADGKGQHITFAFYTDDRGKNWTRGGNAIPLGNENQVVELAGGKLLMNSRDSDDSHRPDHFVRRFALSEDAGQTWKEQWTADLHNPQLHAATKRYTFGGRDVLLYVAPYAKVREAEHPYGRRNLSLQYSADEGKTWSTPQLVHEGTSSYAEILPFEDGSIGVIYERGLPGTDHYWDELAYARLKIDWAKWESTQSSVAK